MTSHTKPITTIWIHCAATNPDHDVTAEEIDGWHKARKWSGIGYHWLIRRSGEVEAGRDEGAVGAHVLGHNNGSIGVCLAGGRGSEATDHAEIHYTTAQLAALDRLIAEIKDRHPIEQVRGHNEVAAKACPGFDVGDYFGFDHRPQSRPQSFVSEPVEEERHASRDPILKLGDRDDPGSLDGPVRRCQEMLKALSFPIGAVDGIFGRGMETGVMAMQAQNDITRDGIMGPVSWNALRTSNPDQVMIGRMNIEITDPRFKESENMQNNRQLSQVGTALSGGGVFAFISQQVGAFRSVSDQLKPVWDTWGPMLFMGIAIVLGVFMAMKGRRGVLEYFENWRSSEYRGR